ncbi:unnamed protein product [Spirodela intermedia]|uniref:AP2/ERF domain-containing protein n=1 Tax=Spirodela intermedia TaxID=51605 RepID=A0A7I8ISI3_SPIIN|nr:unnamed protein product [Spirodela intermedia]CAA6660115.1 unnamed protein product [Spirodela intermedia]
MASMNNWLAFSLSPQEFPPPQPHQNHRLISGDDVSADCFGLTSESSTEGLNIPNLRTDGPFGILEAFNRSQPQSQDWSMKSLDFKGNASELSMVVGSTSNQNDMEVEKPKLEDFLGGNSFPDNNRSLQPGCNSMGGTYDNSAAYMFSNCSLQLPPAASAVSVSDTAGGSGSNNSNSIGLSMIKTWLRSQPGPPQQDGRVTDMVVSGGAVSSSVRNAGVNPSNVQSLSLSMSTGSQSSSPLPLMAASASGGGGAESSSSADNKQKTNSSGTALDVQSGSMEAATRKSIDTFGQRTSIYRGVTRHRWTGRYEAHLWDNSCRREGQTRKGRQVYLGGYDKEEKAARAYDLAALKYWGTTTTTNFPISNYEKELEEMKHMTRQEYVASLRRKSSGFSRGASIYRGVTRHHQHGRWQARIGRVAGNKDLYLGTFSTQEEAAEAYDIAAIKFRGLNAVTNFDMSRYDVKSIIESSALPIGGAAKRLKEASDHNEASIDGRRNNDRVTSQLTEGISNYGSHHHGWSTIAFPQAAPPPLAIPYPYGQQRVWCKQEQDTITALQDLHHLQLGSATQSLFQPSVFHNLVSLDSSSMEHSSGSSNSFIYSGAGGGGGGTHHAVVGGETAILFPSVRYRPTTAIPVKGLAGWARVR